MSASSGRRASRGHARRERLDIHAGGGVFGDTAPTSRGNRPRRLLRHLVPTGGSAPRRHGGAPRVLMVCTANISRSPYAEMRLRQLLGSGETWAVTSAGVPGLVDQPMEPAMSAQARERGVSPEEVAAHRSQPVDQRILDRSALIICMAVEHRRRLVEDYPEVTGRCFTLGQLVEAVQGLEPPGGGRRARRISASVLVSALGVRCPAPDESADVPDPFRRGTEFAAGVAQRIDADLITLVPFLLR